MRDSRISVLLKKYQLLEAEADAHPELMAKFENWGWPAHVILSPTGEVVRIAKGFLSAPGLESFLLGKSGEELNGLPFGTPIRVDQLTRTWDALHIGWGVRQKAIVPAANRFARLPWQPSQLRDKAVSCGKAQQALLDPHWGGVYQYSTQGDWLHPHTEKIARVQAAALMDWCVLSKEDADFDVAAHLQVDFLLLRWKTRQGMAISQESDAVDSRGKRIPGPEYYKLNPLARDKYGEPKKDERPFAMQLAQLAQALLRAGRTLGRKDAFLAGREILSQLLRRRDETGWIPQSKGGVHWLEAQAHTLAAVLELYQGLQDPVILEVARSFRAAILRYDVVPRGHLAGEGFGEPPVNIEGLGVLLQALAVLDAIDDTSLAREILPVILADPEVQMQFGMQGRMIGQFLLGIELTRVGVAKLTIPDGVRVGYALHHECGDHTVISQGGDRYGACHSGRCSPTLGGCRDGMKWIYDALSSNPAAASSL